MFFLQVSSLIFPSAAAETTGTATMSLILALLTHPKVQLKAQREVDSVVGPDRLPDFSDQAHLPYLAAVITEVLRSVAFLSSEDLWTKISHYIAGTR